MFTWSVFRLVIVFVFPGGEGDSHPSSASSKLSLRVLKKALEPMNKLQQENNEKMSALQGQLLVIQRTLRQRDEDAGVSNRDLFLLAAVVLIQTFLFWLFK